MYNVCVNGLFRYDQYIRHFSNRGKLGKFYYSHRISTDAKKMGIRPDEAVNIWFKEYGLHGMMRFQTVFPRAAQKPLFELWQTTVLARWRDAEAALVVIGEGADRVVAHARKRGTTTIGHAVTSHPVEFHDQIAIEHDLLGLPTPSFVVDGRRLEEIEMCDHILADSTFTAKSYIERGIAANRVQVIRPGVDMTRFSPRSLEERDPNRFTVVSVGFATPRKGHRYLLQAWSKIDRSSANLIIVGAESEYTKVLFGPHEGQFTHIPRVPNAQLRNLLVTASVFVLPSVEDGFAQAAMEALACGVPVICSANAGVADLIIDGVNGWVVPARDPDAIADRLSRLMDDPDLTTEMGLNAARLVAEVGGWADYMDQFLEKFDQEGGRAHHVA